MNYEQCARCRQNIRDGDIRYVVRVSVLGDDGGILLEEDYEDPDMKIDELLTQLEGRDAFELENEVYEERIFVLCGTCRKVFLKNPFGLKGDDEIPDDEVIGPMQ